MRAADDIHNIIYKAMDEAASPSIVAAFALYHLPGSDESVWLEAGLAPRELADVEQIAHAGGFVIAPFDTDAGMPVVVVQGEGIRLPIQAVGEMAAASQPSQSGNAPEAACAETEAAERADYHRAFELCHTLLADGDCEKIVLSRTHRIAMPHARRHALGLFANACRRYPHCFTALFATPQTGMWLVSTPETLVDQAQDALRTMALAGTMACHDGAAPALGEWSAKNVREQQLVAQYVRERLDGLAEGLREDGPHPKAVGDIAHLCTDFRLSLRNPADFGRVVRRLHPTPATCGLPRDRALEAIRRAEAPRRCYAGFCGPVGVLGETRLYVSLRCMELHADALILHAGGGLLAESREDDEWRETVCKLKTIEKICSAIIRP